MKRVLFVSMLMTAAVSLTAQTAQTELAKLQGLWVMTGPPAMATAGAHLGLEITGNQYKAFENGKQSESGTVKIDATKKPVALDFGIAEGSDAGKTQLCLVEVTGDTMAIAVGAAGAAERPASLTGGTPVTLTKIKPLPAALAGTWEGAVDANGTQLRLAIKLANGANGLATGTLISVDQGNSELPVSAVVVRGPRVTLIVAGARGTYDGQLKDGQLTGTWSQAGAQLPLVLKRKP